MVLGGRKIHNILFKFRKEESSSRANSKNSLLVTKGIIDQNKIQNELQLFYRNLFKSNCTKSYDDCKKFLDKITTPVLTNEKAKEIYEGDLVESELSNLLRSTLDCKSPGNDRLTKKFYGYSWNVIKYPLVNSIKEARTNKKLTSLNDRL